MSSIDTKLPMPSHIQQIDALQLLRAVAVILVIWFHSSQVLNDSGAYGLPEFGIFGIDLFFVISGFILSLSVLKIRDRPGIKPMAEFMKRRLIRIYPIYWVVCLAMFVRYSYQGLLLKNNYLPAFFLLPEPHYPVESLVMGVSWTLIFEMSFYCILGFILLYSVRSAVPLLIAILGGLVGLGSLGNIRHSVVIVIANPIQLEFVLGAVIALMYTYLKGRRSIGIALTVIGVAEAFILRALSLPHVANSMQETFRDSDIFARVATWGVCAALIVGGVIFWNPSMKNTLGKGFVLIGNASYSIYITCTVVMEYATRVFFRVHKPWHSIAGRVCFGFYQVVMLVAAGILCYILVEKPMLKALQKRFLRDKPQRTTSSLEDISPNRTPKST